MTAPDTPTLTWQISHTNIPSFQPDSLSGVPLASYFPSLCLCCLNSYTGLIIAAVSQGLSFLEG